MPASLPDHPSTLSRNRHSGESRNPERLSTTNLNSFQHSMPRGNGRTGFGESWGSWALDLWIPAFAGMALGLVACHPTPSTPAAACSESYPLSDTPRRSPYTAGCRILSHLPLAHRLSVPGPPDTPGRPESPSSPIARRTSRVGSLTSAAPSHTETSASPPTER